jgi:hypothetical protein
MERKQLDAPIRDFDTGSYDDVEFIPKSEIKVESPKVEQVEEIKVEDELDLTVANGRELLIYFMKRFKESHGYDYKTDWVKEVSILESFRSRYGPDAGPMIAILFDKHEGKLTSGIVTVTAFSKGAKWIQDSLYFELQEKKKAKVVESNVEGLISSNDFRRTFSLSN